MKLNLIVRFDIPRIERKVNIRFDKLPHHQIDDTLTLLQIKRYARSVPTKAGPKR